MRKPGDPDGQNMMPARHIRALSGGSVDHEVGTDFQRWTRKGRRSDGAFAPLQGAGRVTAHYAQSQPAHA